MYFSRILKKKEGRPEQNKTVFSLLRSTQGRDTVTST